VTFVITRSSARHSARYPSGGRRHKAAMPVLAAGAALCLLAAIANFTAKRPAVDYREPSALTGSRSSSSTATPVSFSVHLTGSDRPKGSTLCA
jgi:hypothetical protein